MIKRIMLLMAVVVASANAFAFTPMTAFESDSVAAALAGVWSDYFAKRGAMSDSLSRASYIEGVDAALSAVDSSAAYFQGLEAGVLINSRLEQVEKMGDMKVDRRKFVAELLKIINGEKSRYDVASGNKFMELFINRRNWRGNPVLASEAFIDSVSRKENVATTPSGLMYEVVKEGDGSKHPTVKSTCRLRYKGMLTNGTVIDGTGEMAEEIGVFRAIPGFVEGVQLMSPGAQYRFYIPPHLAYGSFGVPGKIPGNVSLVFDVELLNTD